MSEEKPKPEDVEPSEEDLEDVSGGIGTWPTPEMPRTRTPKATEPLDKQSMEPLDKDTLSR